MNVVGRYLGQHAGEVIGLLAQHGLIAAGNDLYDRARL